MTRLKSIRFDEDIIKIIEKSKGRNFSDKLEKLILHASSADLKKEQADIILRVKVERQELKKYQTQLRKYKDAMITLTRRFNL